MPHNRVFNEYLPAEQNRKFLKNICSKAVTVVFSRTFFEGYNKGFLVFFFMNIFLKDIIISKKLFKLRN